MSECIGCHERHEGDYDYCDECCEAVGIKESEMVFLDADETVAEYYKLWEA